MDLFFYAHFVAIAYLFVIRHSEGSAGAEWLVSEQAYTFRRSLGISHVENAIACDVHGSKARSHTTTVILLPR